METYPIEGKLSDIIVTDEMYCIRRLNKINFFNDNTNINCVRVMHCGTRTIYFYYK